MPVVARKDNSPGTDVQGAMGDSGDAERWKGRRWSHADFIRYVAPHIIPWWNGRAERCGFPLIPDDWMPWSDVLEKQMDGLRDERCFYNAALLNWEGGLPLVVGVHFSWSQIGQALKPEDPVELPLAHAVNLKDEQVLDITWGKEGVMSGVMVGRAFGIAPFDMKAYCTSKGFTE